MQVLRILKVAVNGVRGVAGLDCRYRINGNIHFAHERIRQGFIDPSVQRVVI